MLLLRLAVVGLASLAVLIPTGLLESVAARFRDIGISESSGTLAFRLERFRVALQEACLPILGLGTNSASGIGTRRKTTPLTIFPTCCSRPCTTPAYWGR